jgi:hypothetical protein
MWSWHVGWKWGMHCEGTNLIWVHSWLTIMLTVGLFKIVVICGTGGLHFPSLHYLFFSAFKRPNYWETVCKNSPRFQGSLPLIPQQKTVLMLHTFTIFSHSPSCVVPPNASSAMQLFRSLPQPVLRVFLSPPPFSQWLLKCIALVAAMIGTHSPNGAISGPY